ncbi:MAG TPA: SDR family NAD(P)-dependent oxidoreductase [Frankiaceae bacterium]|jgi:short-subunit dehydrogenase|nr:SDR family NAD(P)-dependent oxidoreductase [Frankiaceae bacterium]
MSAQTIVVTGASGGIGRAVACAFAARGATVVLIARGQKGLEAAAADVRDRGGRPIERLLANRYVFQGIAELARPTRTVLLGDSLG